MTCNFISPVSCIGEHVSAALDLVFTFFEFFTGGIAAVGLEDIIESYKENTTPEPRSMQILGVGLVLFVGILIVKAAFKHYLP